MHAVLRDVRNSQVVVFPNLAARRRELTDDVFQKRRFPRAVCADNRHAAAKTHLGVDLVKNLCVVARVHKIHVVDSHHGLLLVFNAIKRARVGEGNERFLRRAFRDSDAYPGGHR